jgi:uncharacterized protein YdhG (YjbR/CyaY superfamily)
MAKATGSKTAATVDEYIAGFPPDVRSRLEAMRAAVQRIAPEASESIAYGMPAYKLGGPLAYFAAHAGHIGLYALPSAIPAFAERLAGYKTSKGTIQFPHDRELPLDLVEDILRFRIRENQGRTAGGKTKR